MAGSIKRFLAGFMTAAAFWSVSSLALADEPGDEAFVPEGYALTGEVRQCLSARRVDSMDPLNEHAWLVTLRGGETYVNRLNGACRAALRNFTYMQYDLHGGQLCRGEIVRIMDQGSNMISGSCGLGSFEELRPIEPTGE